jgi:hypothetical protein
MELDLTPLIVGDQEEEEYEDEEDEDVAWHVVPRYARRAFQDNELNLEDWIFSGWQARWTQAGWYFGIASGADASLMRTNFAPPGRRPYRSTILIPGYLKALGIQNDDAYFCLPPKDASYWENRERYHETGVSPCDEDYRALKRLRVRRGRKRKRGGLTKAEALRRLRRIQRRRREARARGAWARRAF